MRCPNLHGPSVAENACQIGYALAGIAAGRRCPVHAANGLKCVHCQDMRNRSRLETVDATMP